MIWSFVAQAPVETIDLIWFKSLQLMLVDCRHIAVFSMRSEDLLECFVHFLLGCIR